MPTVREHIIEILGHGIDVGTFNSLKFLADEIQALKDGGGGGPGGGGGTIFVESADPADSQGEDGDIWINSTTGDLFQKEAGTWAPEGNLQGPEGDQGPSGPGTGDMLATEYDGDGDGTVNAADTATEVTGIDAAGASTYYGKDAGGVAGFHALPGKDRISVADHGATGDGVTDDNAAFVAAIAAAGGDTVVVPPGRYRVALDLGVSTTLVGVPGESVLLFGNDAPAIRATGNAGPELTVSAVATVTVNTDDIVTRLTVSDASGISINDFCKVWSQDLRPYEDVGQKNFSGEIFEVMDVDEPNNFVFVHGLLKLPYATSIRLRRLDPDVRINLIGLDIEADGVIRDIISPRANAIELSTLVRPKVENVHLRSSWRAGILLKNSAAGSFKFTTDDLIDDASQDALGYGIEVWGANFGHVVTVHGEGCRHVVTTNQAHTAAYDALDWPDYGEPTACVFKDCTAKNPRGAAFDTHEGGVGLIFDSCHVFEARRTETGTIIGKGFNDRAQDTTFLNCSATGCTAGFALHLEVPHGVRHRVRLDGCWVREQSSVAAGRAAYAITGSSIVDAEVEMVGCEAAEFARGVDILDNVDRVVLSHCRFVDCTEFALEVDDGSAASLVNCTIDLMDSAEGTPALRMHGTSSIEVAGLHIMMPDAVTPGSVVSNQDGAGAKTVAYSGISATFPALKLLGGLAAGITSSSNATTEGYGVVGGGGGGTGDMLQQDYDPDGDGSVQEADAIQGVAIAGPSHYYGTNAADEEGFFSLPPGENTTLRNVGSGAGIWKEKVGDRHDLRSLVAGSGVTLTPAADTITITASGGGGSGTANFISLADYDAIADGSVHTCADQIGEGKPYADLAAFQARYPLAQATTDDLNNIVVQTALNELVASTRRTLFVPRGTGTYVFGAAPAGMSAGIKLSGFDGLHILFEKGAVFAKDATHDSAANFLMTFDRCHDILFTNVEVHGQGEATVPNQVGIGNDHGVNVHSCDRGRWVGGGARYHNGGGINWRTKMNTAPAPQIPDWEFGTIEGAHFEHNENITTTAGGGYGLRIINCNFKDGIVGHIKTSTRIEGAGRIHISDCMFDTCPRAAVEVQNHSDVTICNNEFYNCGDGNSAIIIQSNPDAGSGSTGLTEFETQWVNITVRDNVFQNCLASIEVRNNAQATQRFDVDNVLIEGNVFNDVKAGAVDIVKVWDGPVSEVTVRNNQFSALAYTSNQRPVYVSVWASTTFGIKDRIIVTDNVLIDGDMPIFTLEYDAVNSDRNYFLVVAKGNHGFTDAAGGFVSVPAANIDNLVLDDGGSGGASVPAGGTTGQVLKKASNADFDTQWGVDLQGAGGGGAGTGDWVTFEQFGAVGDGVTNDFSAMQDAADTGKPILVTHGKTFLTLSNVSFSGDMILFGTGRIMTPPGNQLVKDTQWGGSIAVTAIANVEKDGKNVSRLTVSTLSGIDKDDIIKIFSEDLTGVEHDVWMTEMMWVVDVDQGNNWIYVDRELLWNYQTNVSIRRLPQDITHITGITLTAQGNPNDYSITSGRSTSGLDIHGAYRPYIDVYAEESWERFCDAFSCWMGFIQVRSRTLPNAPNLGGGYGYGVELTSCRGTTVTVRNMRCRHNVDLGSRYMSVSTYRTKHWQAGFSFDCIIRDCIAIGGHSSTYTSHIPNINTLWINCVAISPTPDPSGSNPNFPNGFSNRGFGCRWVNCRVTDTEHGFFDSSNEADWTPVANKLGPLTQMWIGCQVNWFKDSRPAFFGDGGTNNVGAQFPIKRYYIDCIAENGSGPSSSGFEDEGTAADLFMLRGCIVKDVEGAAVVLDGPKMECYDLLVDGSGLSTRMDTIFKVDSSSPDSYIQNCRLTFDNAGQVPTTFFDAAVAHTVSIDNVYSSHAIGTLVGGSATRGASRKID